MDHPTRLPSKRLAAMAAVLLLPAAVLLNGRSAAQLKPQESQNDPNLELKDRRVHFAELEALKAQVSAMTWKKWTPSTTWDSDVKATGQWRRVGNSVEVIIEVVPTKSSADLSERWPGLQRRLVIDLPKEVEPMVPRLTLPANVGSATYWNTANSQASVGSTVLCDDFLATIRPPKNASEGTELYNKRHVLVAIWHQINGAVVQQHSVSPDEFQQPPGMPLSAFQPYGVRFEFRASFPIEATAAAPATQP